MYIPVSVYANFVHPAGTPVDGEAKLLLAAEWLNRVVEITGSIVFQVLSWILHVWQAIGSVLSDILQNPGAWCLYSIRMTYDLLHRHPQVVCFVSLCLFLGPMVLLLPFILAHEIAVLFLFNLSFITHGLVPGRVEDQYDALKERFVESREMVFSSVDAATATFNQWTTDHFLLRLLRIAAGVTGIWTLVGLWMHLTQIQY